MKNGFRFLLLLIVAFAIYGGFVSGEWFFPNWMMVICFICFICTFKKVSSTVNSLSDLFD
jgi:hypothetical protein